MTTVPVTQQLPSREQRKKLLRTLRFPAIFFGVLILAATIAVLSAPRTSNTSFAPDNPAPQGARALAEVLQRQGVEITYAQDRASAEDALLQGGTLFVVNDHDFGGTEVESLLQAASNVVVLSPSVTLTEYLSDTLELGMSNAGTPAMGDTSPAQCSLPSAIAAEKFESNGTGFDFESAWEDGVTLPDSVTACFPADWGWHLVSTELADGTPLTLIDDPAAWTNNKILDSGNAALALHVLGQEPRLVWYLPKPEPVDDTLGIKQAEWPIGFKIAAATAALIIVFLAIWQGRRFGPVIRENLPVIVKSSETSLGRGRLYRASSARGHAAASLRSGTASRLALRLGIAPSHSNATFISTVATAAGKDEKYVQNLFYGPAPANDSELTDLAQRLSDIESEIHA